MDAVGSAEWRRGHQRTVSCDGGSCRGKGDGRGDSTHTMFGLEALAAAIATTHHIIKRRNEVLWVGEWRRVSNNMLATAARARKKECAKKKEVQIVIEKEKCRHQS